MPRSSGEPRSSTAQAEHALHSALGKVSEATGPDTDLQRFAAGAAALTGPINDFFDQVLVMADDPAIKANRLGLLASVYHLAERHLGWEQLP